MRTSIPAVKAVYCSNRRTEYAANYRIENGAITMIHTDAGYYTLFPAPPGGTVPVFKHIWYMKDHLGNNRVLLDASGKVYAVHHYDPFGGEISVASLLNVTQFPTSATESPYKYGGKEWNETTSSYDFEARQMAPSFHRFMTMDPLAEKYYGISPYVYCANNPVNLVDKDGKKLYFAKGSSREFKKRFAEAVKIMNDKGISYNIAKLHESESTYYIAESSDESYAITSLNGKTATVFWNPNNIIILNESIQSSPVTVLAHEMSHVAGYDESPETYYERRNQKDSDYDDKEEKRVIEGDEQIAARKLGEITPDMVTRNGHSATDLIIPFGYSVSLEDMIKMVSENNIKQY